MMNRWTRILVCSFVSLGCLWTAGAAAADSSQWRGPNRDGKTAPVTLPQTWPKSLTPQWKVKVGSSDATPALVGGKLYVFARQGPSEVTLCLDAANGKTIWQSKYEPGVTVTGGPASHPGPRSSPAVGEGKVVTLGVSGVLSCLDAADGKLVWRKQTAKDFPEGWPRFYVASSPLLIGDLCIVQLGGQGNGAVVAFELKTGDVKWKAAGDGPAYASPVPMTVDGTEMLVAQTEKSLVGLTLSDGKIQWQIPTPAKRMMQNAVSPIVSGQVVIFSGQGNGTRAVQITKNGDAYAPKDLWSNEQVGGSFNTPVLKDNLLFGLSNNGNIFCLDAPTGKTMWTSTEKRGSRGFGSIVDAGPVLLALTNDSRFFVFKPSEKGYEELANIKVSDAPTYSQPVAAGNRVYIEDQEAVSAFVIE
jgi:outer membrane protein assembly factor BamB